MFALMTDLLQLIVDCCFASGCSFCQTLLNPCPISSALGYVQHTLADLLELWWPCRGHYIMRIYLSIYCNSYAVDLSYAGWKIGTCATFCHTVLTRLILLKLIPYTITPDSIWTSPHYNGWMVVKLCLGICLSLTILYTQQLHIYTRSFFLTATIHE